MDNTFIGPVAGGYMTPSYAWIVNPDTLEYATVQLDNTARDPLNTTFRTTYLRPGLALGKVTATGRYKEYDDADGDGTEVARCILAQGVDLLDPLGNVRTDHPAGVSVVVGGHVDPAYIIGKVSMLDANGKTDLTNAGFLLKTAY